MLRRKLSRIRHLFERKAIALMYHRIADIAVDPWQIAVSSINFEQHLQVLKKRYKVISVNQLINQIGTKSISSNNICLTFDDGYRDNYLTAKPLLEKYQCPASFFIPTEYIGLEEQYWWDELQTIILSSAELPASLSILIHEKLFEFQLESPATLTPNELKKQQSWTWLDKPPTQRCELYLALWERLQPLSNNELNSTLRKIKLWANFNEPGCRENFPMTSQQLNNIGSHPLFEIGIHTVTHSCLPFHSMEVQYKEITDCKQNLENNLGRPINTIAYPYGNYNDITLNIIKNQKLTAFSCDEWVITNRANPLRLGRFQVRNWTGEEFERQLFNWINNSRFHYV